MIISMSENNIFSDEIRNICTNLIAVTNRKLSSHTFLEQTERICLLHPKALILREKDLSEAEYKALAVQTMRICSEYSVQCILHSYPEAAMELNCRAIHLPLYLLEKYHNISENFDIIGSSVHSVEEAVKAQNLGATYITAGHIFTTDCKKNLPPRGLSFLKDVVSSVSIPVYGIGGIKINSDQIKKLLDCGAAGGCVMSEMMKI